MAAKFTPRASQSQILNYSGGRLGISAVPGSGKTQTLSALAAHIITSGKLQPGQEVLVVTLVNSAVDNFTSRISDFLPAGGPLAGALQLGYRVRTLHGLAHDIVREHPAVVGLDDGFSIVDESVSLAMVRAAADGWLEQHPDSLDGFLSAGIDDRQRRKIARRDWPEYLEGISASFIRAAKDRHLSPQDLAQALGRSRGSLPLAEMGLAIYTDYQRALEYRGAVDFDDLIRLAYQVLEASPQLLERLQQRWPFILEDEAQDSSRIQQQIISRLVGRNGNWVRVGDPNQAIFETFTTADPALLRDFIARNAHVNMPESGRCQPAIMDLANHLIDWVRTQHPLAEARDALAPPYIEAAPPGDAQPNPRLDPDGVELIGAKFSAAEEIKEVVRSLEAWLPEHPADTVAVLTCTNDYATQVAEALKIHRIEYRELLRSTTPTRAAAGALSYLLDYLASPDSGAKLSQAYRVWRRDWREDLARRPIYDHVSALLRRLRRVEEYVAPLVPAGSAAAIEQPVTDEFESAEVLSELSAFRNVIQRWQTAALLPVDQLILALSQEIFTAPADLALGHKLALVMRQVADENAEWRLPELIPSLNEIALNERRFIGFSADDAGFNPDDHPGIVVVSTMHKAKGLEWDRVYLLSVNNYDYPSGLPEDRFISEKWYIRDGLNLEAEALAQLDMAVADGGLAPYSDGAASLEARLGYVRERLRLMYVGITRARKQLIVSWNRGRRGDAVPAVPFRALKAWSQQGRAGTNPADLP